MAHDDQQGHDVGILNFSLEEGPLNFEIRIFFANAFESTLPLPKVHDLNSRWLVPGLADVDVIIFGYSIGFVN